MPAWHEGLHRAQAALVAGKPLVCGFLCEDLSTGQRRWLAKHLSEALSDEAHRVMTRRPDHSAAGSGTNR